MHGQWWLPGKVKHLKQLTPTNSDFALFQNQPANKLNAITGQVALETRHNMKNPQQNTQYSETFWK